MATHLARTGLAALNVAIVTAGLGLTFLMLAQIVMRYLLGGGFLGIEEIAVLFGVWFYFLGMARASLDGDHIRGGIASLLANRPGQIRWLDRIDLAVVSLGNVIFTVLAVRYSITLAQSGRASTYMGWPSWLWAVSMVCGFALATVFELRRQRAEGGS